MLMSPGSLRQPIFSQPFRQLIVEPTSRCLEYSSGLVLFAMLRNRSPRVPPVQPEYAEEYDTTTKTRTNLTLDPLSHLTTLIAERVTGLSGRLNIATWQSAEGVVKSELLETVALPSKVPGFGSAWRQHLNVLEMGSLDPISLAMQGDFMALRSWAVGVQLQVVCVNAAALVGASQGSTIAASRGFNSSMTAARDLLLLASQSRGGTNSNATGRVFSNMTRSTDIEELFRATVALDPVQAGTMPADAVLAVAVEMTRSITERMENTVRGGGDFSGFSFYSNTPQEERPAMDASLRVAVILGLQIYSQLDILPLIRQATEGVQPPEEVLAFSREAAVESFASQRVDTLAKVMGLDAFHASSILKCPLGGCSSFNTGVEFDDISGAPAAWVIAVAVAAVLPVMALAGAAYCVYTQRTRSAAGAPHPAPSRWLQPGRQKDKIRISEDARLNGGMDPGSMWRVLGGFTRQLVVGIPMPEQRQGATEAESAKGTAPLKEVYGQLSSMQQDDGLPGFSFRTSSETRRGAKVMDDLVLFDVGDDVDPSSVRSASSLSRGTPKPGGVGSNNPAATQVSSPLKGVAAAAAVEEATPTIPELLGDDAWAETFSKMTRLPMRTEAAQKRVANLHQTSKAGAAGLVPSARGMHSAGSKPRVERVRRD
mmetsp:Transcript_18762/g.52237  ORF Transcript_18762/g.52237 Transcript_18762/m.52237 type:complete len:655 (-) Transcript_18762:158-2122(-)